MIPTVEPLEPALDFCSTDPRTILGSASPDRNWATSCTSLRLLTVICVNKTLLILNALHDTLMHHIVHHIEDCSGLGPSLA